MAGVTVRASSGGVGRGIGNPRTLTFPGTPVVGDTVVIVMSTDANPTMTTPSGWTLGYSSNNVNGSKHLIYKTYASGDGSSLAITFSADPNLVWAIVVIDGSVHTGLGTFGTVTTRGSSSSSSTASATGSSADPNLVIFHEKAATHTSAPTVSGVTAIQNQYDTTASGASTYVGYYDTSGGTASKTANYSTASTNGAGLQIPVTMGGVSASSSGTGTATATVIPTQNVSAAPSGTGTATASVVPTVAVSAAASGTGTATAAVSSASVLISKITGTATVPVGQRLITKITGTATASALRLVTKVTGTATVTATSTEIDVEPFSLVTLPSSGFILVDGPGVTWVVVGQSFYAPVVPFDPAAAPVDAVCTFTKGSQTVIVSVLPHTRWYHDGTHMVPLQ